MDADELRLWVFQTTLFGSFSCEKAFEVRKHKDTEHTKKRLRFFDHIRHIRASKFLNEIFGAPGVLVVSFFWSAVLNHLRQLSTPEAWFKNFDHIKHIRTFKFLNKIFGVFVVKFILKLLMLPIIGAE
jgi:hypothetical protein